MKDNIKYIGKSLFVDNSILIMGDLHLGYDGSLRESGYSIQSNLYKDTIDEVDKIISSLGERVKTIVLLGDLKHEFGSILKEEWKEVLNFLDYLEKHCKKIIILKGNHDVIIEPIIRKKNIEINEYFVINNYCFLHGDKNYDEIYEQDIKYWIVGHGHPAITLYDGVKKEKYKCFLVGNYKGKNIIILPSFFPLNEGSDPRDYALGLYWNFDLQKFNVKIVGEDLEVIDFGLLRSLPSAP